MRQSMVILGIVTSLVLGIGITSPQAAETTSPSGKPDATIRLSKGSVSAGVGVSWGGGTISYQGKDYPIRVNGLSVGSVGAGRISASGNVFHLSKLEDFNGNYTAAGAGAAVGGGVGAVTMRNQNGVVVNLTSTTQGVKFNLGPSGVSMNVRQ